LNFEDEGGESKRCLKKRKNLTKMKTSKKKRALKSSARDTNRRNQLRNG
jgi:hypothetical protein